MAHDTGALDASDLERTIGPAVRLAVDNERLQAESLAQLHDLRASRARVVELAETERRRLERDLHDGAQQQLLALNYDLRLARTGALVDGDAELAAILGAGGEQAQLALDELRVLAHGIYPTILREAGLGPALMTLAGEAPLPVELDPIAEKRYPAALESAAYRTVIEAVRDAAHSGASHARVRIAPEDDRLIVEVHHDGAPRTSADVPRRRPRRSPRRPSRRRAHVHTRGDPVRVVVAEDVMLTREGIVRLLTDAGVEVVGQAEDLDGLLRRVRATRPDAAIVDIRMPPTHTDEGLVAAQAIREEQPDVGVLVLSQYLEPEYAMRLIEQHPERVGYLLKQRIFDGAILVDALRRITDGRDRDRPHDRRAPRRSPPPRGPAGRAHRARARGARPHRRRPLQPRDRRRAVRHRAHRRSPHHTGVLEARP